MIWSREEFGDEYGYRPVINTVVTHDVPIYEVKIRHDNGLEETFNTTEGHPFWIDGQGWRKASILESGMRMLDKHGNATAEIISQEKLDKTDTVYNFEVQDFHTYHIGEVGLWVHNDECCKVNAGTKNNWSEDINKEIKPNTRYEVKSNTHVHTYHTDRLGRVKKVEGQLSLDKIDRNGYQQQKVGKAENATGDEGGHLIATILGGAGDKINMVPQARTLNRSDWKKMENQLRKELQAGKSVSVKIDMKYPNNSTRPNKFTVTALINGTKTTFTFTQ